MAKKGEGVGAGETRLVRFDADFHGTVQLEVAADLSSTQAREQAERVLRAAVARAEEDKSVKLTKEGGDTYLDPRSTKAS